MKLKLLLAIAALYPAHSFAATKTPPLKICANNAGAISAKTRCAKGELQMGLNNLAVQGATGAQGEKGAKGDKGDPGLNGQPGTTGQQGPRGFNGGFDWTKCVKKTQSGSGSSLILTKLTCDSGQFLITHGMIPDTLVSISQINLTYDSTDRIAVGVSYITYTPGTAGFMNVTVTGVCCVP